MLTITFIRPIDLVASLNINGSFYNKAIIKQNNMTYQSGKTQTQLNRVDNHRYEFCCHVYSSTNVIGKFDFVN